MLLTRQFGWLRGHGQLAQGLKVRILSQRRGLLQLDALHPLRDLLERRAEGLGLLGIIKVAVSLREGLVPLEARAALALSAARRQLGSRLSGPLHEDLILFSG